MRGPHTRPRDDDAVVLRPTMGRRILYTLVGLFLVNTIPYLIQRTLTSPGAAAASREPSVIPTWLEWVIAVLLAPLGVFMIVTAWRSRTWVADDWISHRALKSRRTLQRDEATGIRIKASGHQWRTLDIHIDRHTDDERYSIYISSFLVPVGPVLDTLREWALRRPSLVTDERTRGWLGVAPRAQS